MRIISLLPIAAALLLCQCSPKPAEAPASASSAAPKSFAYDLTLTLAPEAAARVAKHKQMVTISAMYYGNARPATAAMADKSDGTIHLDTDVVTVEPKDQTVHMTGAGVDPARLPNITAQKPLVLINVYSGAKIADTMIRCTGFQDYVSTAQETPIAIHCE